MAEQHHRPREMLSTQFRSVAMIRRTLCIPLYIFGKGKMTSYGLTNILTFEGLVRGLFEVKKKLHTFTLFDESRQKMLFLESNDWVNWVRPKGF